VNLAMLNTSALDRTPTLSRDGHWLFFASNRPGGAGGLDIWVSYRARTHDELAWEPPVNLGPGVNIATGDTGPAYLAGHRGRPARLYFARGTVTSNTDIYVSEQAEDGTWQPAVPVAEVNSELGDANPDLSLDGRVMLFHSTRTGTAGAFDNWVATRRHADHPFSPPVRLSEPLNGPTADRDAAFSRHGDAIVISSDRPGGYGLLDLYISRRER
jgi:peptidoglycan-associated lipoprotein